MIFVDNVTTCQANAGSNLPFLSVLGVGKCFSTYSGPVFFTNLQAGLYRI